jgi:hypothetical protein
MQKLERAIEEMPSSYSVTSMPVLKSDIKQTNHTELKESFKDGYKHPIKSNNTFYNHHPFDEGHKVHKTNRIQSFIYIIIGLGVGFLSFQLFLFLIVIYIRLI